MTIFHQRLRRLDGIMEIQNVRPVIMRRLVENRDGCAPLRTLQITQKTNRHLPRHAKTSREIRLAGNARQPFGPELIQNCGCIQTQNAAKVDRASLDVAGRIELAVPE